jgi:hypothetical protein
MSQTNENPEVTQKMDNQRMKTMQSTAAKKAEVHSKNAQVAKTRAKTLPRTGNLNIIRVASCRR